ncbi:MAG: phage antirepressor KilAC domain-containing protein, partial [Firmicutes bacterium]|nr:phage antirepressor KilAC domain-containing protein [Bacillota bacterium]
NLNSFLKDRGVQRWKRGQYRLTENYEGRGLAQDRLFVYYGKDGKTKRSTYLVWTTKGAEMIEEMVKPKKDIITN